MTPTAEQLVAIAAQALKPSCDCYGSHRQPCVLCTARAEAVLEAWKKAGVNLDGPATALETATTGETGTTGVIRGIFVKRDGSISNEYRVDIGQMLDDLTGSDRFVAMVMVGAARELVIEYVHSEGFNTCARGPWREAVAAAWTALQESEK